MYKFNYDGSGNGRRLNISLINFEIDMIVLEVDIIVLEINIIVIDID